MVLWIQELEFIRLKKVRAHSHVNLSTKRHMYKVLDVVGIAALLAVGFIAAHFAIGVVIGLAMF